MSYSTPSQVVERQLEYFDGKHVLLAGELEDTFATQLLSTAASVSIFTTNLAYANQMKRFDNLNVQFGASYQAQPNVDMVLLYWPKAKAEAEFLLAMLMAALGKDTEIVVVGENRSGVKSIEKMFPPYGRVTKFDSARRCSFYWGQCINTPAPFNIDDWYKSYPLDIHGQTLTVRSLPGVFSHGEFDAGSQLLLNTLPALKGAVLDFGCGAGVIGSAIKLLNPNAHITMVDISALAVESAKETLRFNNLDGTVLASDVYSDIDGHYDNVISNPPFHAGLKTHYAATETFLELAPKHLSKNGQLMIVANSFLRYPAFIESAFGHCNTPAKNNKFAIYHAIKNA
ncbi:16S rRNA (guanine(1207)-N(2))-methyltransferase RsmC [Enterovibrio nigricans]|uniref:Ribosomal RNA small subunit methyltransferase C n=1 Tax=Enterovibrio nigricans DSM 22720 TaxID=1121868 RepID=A0A1T4TTU4_9GAMM|nr:16S rRNA (guanine(1207)-N(2))-methyltransferase RsmC [Enterovibrio nigricans]PKF51941.1 16S rRNA (guanine(1207)-N(2))-methyltransferase RsmC [Enterovibrio nigricans]SKA43867.1 16S rRNA (guanine1207-N2)-methyltransferase [Enterovibrio nigricans DSM 22720]